MNILWFFLLFKSQDVETNLFTKQMYITALTAHSDYVQRYTYCCSSSELKALLADIVTYLGISI